MVPRNSQVTSKYAPPPLPPRLIRRAFPLCASLLLWLRCVASHPSPLRLFLARFLQTIFRIESKYLKGGSMARTRGKQQ